MISRHPKRVTAAVVAVLMGGGGGAFAVSKLAPDPADLPVQQIVEFIDALPLAAPDPSTSGPALVLYRSELTRSSDTADGLLKRLGVNDVQAVNFLRQNPLARQLLGRAGRHVTAQVDDLQQLQRLTARWVTDDSGQFQRLVIQRSAEGLTAAQETAALQASNRLASGTIESSLFAATDAAGLPDAIAIQIAEIFSTDIDFRRALRKNDRFSVVYEVLEADGEPLRTGRVLSAEFVNAGKNFQAMWFEQPHTGRVGAAPAGAYYTLEGQSLRRAFLSSPVAFSRVSSGFAMRFHPVLKQWQKHLGTDFAAPAGTPARTVGDGVISFAGWQRGYGNVVYVQHRGSTDTVYAHLSKILVKRGERVEQGQTIGLVGATGWATGPHLHFEVREGGVQRDPMAMAQRSETVPVPAALMPQFRQLASQVRVDLQAASSLQVARFE